MRDLFKQTNGVVDVDWYVEDDQPKYRLIVDKEKAALNGISEDDIARTMQVASAGYEAGLLHQDAEKEDVPLIVRLDRASAVRSGSHRKLENSRHATGTWWRSANWFTSRTSHRRQEHLPQESDAGDLCDRGRRGRDGEPGLRDPRSSGPRSTSSRSPKAIAIEQHMAALPTDPARYSMKWDGEWHITYEVFRDLGIAFAAVLILIYGLVVGLVSVVPDAADHHGGDPVLAGWHSARARFDACVFHRDLDDRLHRRRRHRGAELDHPGGLHRTASGARACRSTKR